MRTSAQTNVQKQINYLICNVLHSDKRSCTNFYDNIILLLLDSPSVGMSAMAKQISNSITYLVRAQQQRAELKKK